MNTSIIIDVQGTNPQDFPGQDNGYYLNRWKERNIPVNIALTPYQRANWRHLESQIGELISRPGSNLFLEGLIHTCPYKNHKIRDPHHEHVCTSWFKRSSSYAYQLDDIADGIKFLQKIFGKKPEGFIPPQHLWNEKTRLAVETSGLKYLVTNAMFDQMQPYQEGNVIIVPSSSLNRVDTLQQVMHVYFDRIKDNPGLFDQIESSAVPLEVVPLTKKTLKHTVNSPYIWVARQLRDGQRLLKWLSSKEARNAPGASRLWDDRFDMYWEQRPK